MSAREWKPGDVARTKAGGTVARTAKHEWVLLDDGHGIDIGDDRIARPLVVIDPEDREQVERLTQTMRANGWTGIDDDATDDMQRVLRELADQKPRIEEPTGLGAVVEDAEGKRWIRTTTKTDRAAWDEVTDGPVGLNVWWVDVFAVRVLSEGVTS